jgi:hypothetical protein
MSAPQRHGAMEMKVRAVPGMRAARIRRFRHTR